MGNLRLCLLGSLLIFMFVLSGCQFSATQESTLQNEGIFSLLHESVLHAERANALSYIPEEERTLARQRELERESFMATAKSMTSAAGILLLLLKTGDREITSRDIARAGRKAASMMGRRETGIVNIYDEKNHCFVWIEILDYVGKDQSVAVLRYVDDELRGFWLRSTTMENTSKVNQYLIRDISVEEMNQYLIEEKIITRQEIEALPSLDRYREESWE